MAFLQKYKLKIFSLLYLAYILIIFNRGLKQVNSYWVDKPSSRVAILLKNRNISRKISIGNRIGPSKIIVLISRMFSQNCPSREVTGVIL